MAGKIEIDRKDKEKEEMISPKTDVRPEVKPNEVPPERIERMKKAFRPTWLQEQINSAGKSSDGKKE